MLNIGDNNTFFALEVRPGRIMTDLAIISASAKATLLEIAKQADALGNGLQNAAPGEKTGLPNPSVQYLLSIAEDLKEIALAFEAESSYNSSLKP